MAGVDWDRLLETCVVRTWNAVLTVGQPPIWRSEVGLRQGQVMPLGSDDLRSMVEELVEPGMKVEKGPGLSSFLLSYGGSERFRVDVIGEPCPTSIILTRILANAPELIREGSGWFEGWKVMDGALIWRDLVRFSKTDVIFAAGCPPLRWCEWGVTLYGAPVMTEEKIAEIVKTIKPPPAGCSEAAGYLLFRFRADGARDEFLVSVFGGGSPGMIHFMRMEVE